MANQGDLDGLCGVYAIVNAVFYCSAIRAKFGGPSCSRDQLFARAVNCPSFRRGEHVHAGVTVTTLRAMLRELGVHFRSLAELGVAADKRSLNKQLRQALSQRGTAVILGYDTASTAHWVALDRVAGDKSFTAHNNGGVLINNITAAQNPKRGKKFVSPSDVLLLTAD
eukprot:TRINITY_DN18330_c0_g1_i1.p1 TRINITY_DN18330_c0_g1~~TRINITY_DN18330_c0_g1_i1.p1  ORF type:complete len:180 (-),score=45.15 TRINITY_DN18330_c0_g1_i1:104-607(-)